MMEVEVGNKLIEVGREKQSEANERLSEILEEINNAERQLYKLSEAVKCTD